MEFLFSVLNLALTILDGLLGTGNYFAFATSQIRFEVVVIGEIILAAIPWAATKLAGC